MGTMGLLFSCVGNYAARRIQIDSVGVLVDDVVTVAAGRGGA